MRKRVISTAVALMLMGSTIAYADTSIHNFTNINSFEQGKTFTDVNASDWFAKDVQSVYELNLMGGKGNAIFDAKGNLTLAEAITMASRVNNIYNGGDSVIQNDGSGTWYGGSVKYAIEKGIITSGGLSTLY